MIAGFKKFIIQGNAVDLAVGVVIGAAFGAVIKSITDGIITPIVQIVMPDSAKDLSTAHFTINGSTFMWGNVVNTLITFVFTALAVYFLVVVPINALKERRARGGEDEEPTNEERIVELLERIAAK